MVPLTLSPAIPTLDDVRAARERIGPYLQPTPLYHYPTLSELIGTEVWVKHENHQPVGAFKVRGGVNLVAQLSAEERARGLITASTGNHGQSIAYAARLFGVRATVCVPEAANPVKVEAIRAFGAEIIAHGRDFDEARVHCARLAAEQGLRYVHSGNEPHLIAGVATTTLEISRAATRDRGCHRSRRRRQRRRRRLHRRRRLSTRHRDHRGSVRRRAGRLPLMA